MLLWRQGWVTSPHDGVLILNSGGCCECLSAMKHHATSVPELCLALVHVYPRMSPELSLQ